MQTQMKLTSIILFGLILAGCIVAESTKNRIKSETSIIETDMDRLIELSREAHWTYPTSSGRPVPPEPPEWLARVSAKRSAYVETAHSLLEQDDFASATELAANAWRLWILGRDDAGGRKFLTMVLDHPGNTEPTRWRALALYGDSLFAFRLGHNESSRERSSDALKTARAANDTEAEILALLGLSRVELTDGDWAAAREHAARSLELAKGFRPALSQSQRHMIAQAARLEGDLDEAARLFRQSLELNRRLGDRGMVAVELHNLGHIELRRGFVDIAEKLFEESASMDKGDDPYGTAMQLFNQASIAFARGDGEAAASLLRKAHATLSDAGIEPAMDDATEMNRLKRQIEQSPQGH